MFETMKENIAGSKFSKEVEKIFKELIEKLKLVNVDKKHEHISKALKEIGEGFRREKLDTPLDQYIFQKNEHGNFILEKDGSLKLNTDIELEQIMELVKLAIDDRHKQEEEKIYMCGNGGSKEGITLGELSNRVKKLSNKYVSISDKVIPLEEYNNKNDGKKIVIIDSEALGVQTISADCWKYTLYAAEQLGKKGYKVNVVYKDTTIKDKKHAMVAATVENEGEKKEVEAIITHLYTLSIVRNEERKELVREEAKVGEAIETVREGKEEPTQHQNMVSQFIGKARAVMDVIEESEFADREYFKRAVKGIIEAVLERGNISYGVEQINEVLGMLSRAEYNNMNIEYLGLGNEGREGWKNRERRKTEKELKRKKEKKLEKDKQELFEVAKEGNCEKVEEIVNQYVNSGHLLEELMIVRYSEGGVVNTNSTSALMNNLMNMDNCEEVWSALGIQVELGGMGTNYSPIEDPQYNQKTYCYPNIVNPLNIKLSSPLDQYVVTTLTD